MKREVKINYLEKVKGKGVKAYGGNGGAEQFSFAIGVSFTPQHVYLLG